MLRNVLVATASGLGFGLYHTMLRNVFVAMNHIRLVLCHAHFRLWMAMTQSALFPFPCEILLDIQETFYIFLL